MKHSFSGKFSVFKSPHLWVILFLIAGLAFIYYDRVDFTSVYFPWFKSFIKFEFSNNLNGLLFLIPFIYATLIFWWRGALVSVVLSIAIMLPYISYMALNTKLFIYNILYLSIPFVVIAFFAVELKWREKERRISAEREVERKSYTSQIFKAQENERYRIAQELHDDTVQMLYVIANQVRDLATEENSQDVQSTKRGTENIRKSILSVAEDVRRISLDLRPSILDDLSLVPAIRWLIDRLSQENGLNIQITVFGTEKGLRPESEVMIYRIIQEALNNIKKHSKATDVWVILKFTSHTCEIRVQDNGIGFTVPAKAGHFVSEGKLGLIGMQQRSEFMGGSFKIQSEPGKGTSISVEVPF